MPELIYQDGSYGEVYLRAELDINEHDRQILKEMHVQKIISASTEISLGCVAGTETKKTVYIDFGIDVVGVRIPDQLAMDIGLDKGLEILKKAQTEIKDRLIEYNRLEKYFNIYKALNLTAKKPTPGGKK